MPVINMPVIDVPTTERWAAGLFLALALMIPLLPALARPLGRLVKLAVKTLAALGSLALLQPIGGLVGLSLGVNVFNALTLALLGLPGLGLLMMLEWTCKL